MIFAIGSKTKTTFSIDIKNETVDIAGPNIKSSFTVSPSQFYDINSGDIGRIRDFVKKHITFEDTFLPPFITSQNLAHLKHLDTNLWSHVLFTEDGYSIFENEGAANYAIELFKHIGYTLSAEQLKGGDGHCAINVFCLATGHDYGFLKIDFDTMYGEPEKSYNYKFRIASGATLEFSAINIQSAIAKLASDHGVSDHDIVSVEQTNADNDENDSPLNDINIAILGGAGMGLTSALIKELTEKCRGITITSGEKGGQNTLINEIPYHLHHELNKRRESMLFPLAETVKRQPNFPIAGQRKKKGKFRSPIPK
jgi:hypothetical protein